VPRNSSLSIICLNSASSRWLFTPGTSAGVHDSALYGSTKEWRELHAQMPKDRIDSTAWKMDFVERPS
jgi:hypothetical protein